MRLQAVIELTDESHEVSIERIKPGSQLNDVEPAHASLHLAHGRLATANTPRKIRLTQTLRLPLVAQQAQEYVVMAAVQRLEH